MEGKFMKKLLISACVGFSVLGLAACGGSDGDDDDDVLFVSGVWRGAFTLTENTCNIPNQPQTFNFVHTVNQNEESVILETDAGQRFLGNVLSDQGFSVDAVGAQNQSAGTNITCNFNDRIEYDGVFDDDDNDADAELRLNGTCSNGATCRLTYQGTATRNSTGGGVTPTPVGTPAARGACSSMTERTYSGNEGCALGDLALRQSGNGLILEPFGVNGATSFNQSSSDASAATSTRTDLSVNGEDGYSCSVSCAPPITFTVTCFKEGGTTCEERF
jgi:hypothetical protein